jgi:copper chaperone
METLKFKTNIKCGGCIAAVTPYLNQLSDIEKWDVDTQSPDKILTIEGKLGIDDQKVIDTLEGAGYRAEKVN